jgi:hypothetical protein
MVEKVICIDDAGMLGYLTLGKIYEVFEDEDLCWMKQFYLIIDDSNSKTGFAKWRFRPYDCNHCIERKCNSCELNKEKL